MKIFYFLLWFTTAGILFVNTSCQKDSPISGPGNANAPSYFPPLPPILANRPPVVNAGPDLIIVLLSNNIVVRGQATDPDIGNTLSSTWTKIAGPACTILSPQSLTTTIDNLLEGEYQFELSVSDNFGATDRDTVVVKAINNITSANEANFLSLSWYCPMGCTIEIDKFFSHIPPNRPFRVLIKPENQTAWYEAFPISQYSLFNSIYFYQIYDDRLTVYTESDARGTADIKILF